MLIKSKAHKSEQSYYTYDVIDIVGWGIVCKICADSLLQFVVNILLHVRTETVTPCNIAEYGYSKQCISWGCLDRIENKNRVKQVMSYTNINSTVSVL